MAAISRRTVEGALAIHGEHCIRLFAARWIMNTISYTEVFAPIPEDIHQVLKSCIHRGL